MSEHNENEHNENETNEGHEPFRLDPPRNGEPPRRRGRTALAALLGLLLIAGLGVGGYFGYQRHTEQQAIEAAAAKKAEKKADKRRAEKKAAAAIAACEREIGDYVNELADLDARLDVGMNVTEYGDAVADASVEERRIDMEGLSPTCEDAKTAADRALYAYSRVASDWNDCVFDDYYCDAELDLDLPRDWQGAGDYVVEAEDLMNGHGGDTV